MLPTTVPAMLITLAVYWLADSFLISPAGASFARIESITTTLDAEFRMGLLPLLPALVAVALAVTRQPPLPSLFAGVLPGVLIAIIW